MSTKAIRALIERAKKDSAAISRSAVGWPDAGLMADKALLEVDAIERTAKELLEIWGYARHDIEAEKTMESIAKDAP